MAEEQTATTPNSGEQEAGQQPATTLTRHEPFDVGQLVSARILSRCSGFELLGVLAFQIKRVVCCHDLWLTHDPSGMGTGFLG